MRGRAARWVRWLGMAAAIAIPTGATAFVVAGPASATDPTAHVSFTASGVAQKTLTIKPGTDVVFSNDIDPTQVTILGPITGLVHSVSVTVTGATQKPFVLQRNQEATVPAYTSGSQPFVIDYKATYTATTLGLPDPTTKTFNAEITVSPNSSSPKPTTQPTTAPPSSTTQPSQNPTQQPTSHSPSTSANSSSGQSSASTQATIPGYRPPGPDVASQVVPKGDGGSYTTDSTTSRSSDSSTSHSSGTSSTSAHQSSTKRTSSSHTTTEVAAGDPVTPNAKNSANEQPLDTAANQTGALPSSFNWPAIMAVALLSTVGVALVRTFAAHRRGN
jgi:hypothetical protein